MLLRFNYHYSMFLAGPRDNAPPAKKAVCMMSLSTWTERRNAYRSGCLKFGLCKKHTVWLNSLCLEALSQNDAERCFRAVILKIKTLLKMPDVNVRV